MPRDTPALAAILACSTFAALVFAASWGKRRKHASASAANVPPMPSPSSAAEGKSDAIIPLWEVEKRTIMAALEKLNGDKLLAATRLGIGKTTFYRKLKKYGIKMETTSHPRTENLTTGRDRPTSP